MGLKKQTIRCLFIPTYIIGEIVKINFKQKLLFQAKIKGIFPKLIKDITDKDARLDGFLDRSDCLNTLFVLHSVKTAKQRTSLLNRYCFVISFEPISTLFDFVENKIIVFRGLLIE